MESSCFNVRHLVVLFLLVRIALITSLLGCLVSHGPLLYSERKEYLKLA